MPVDFTGKWELESHGNLENYLQALDIGFPLRKIAAHLTPTKIFTQDGDNFVIKTQSAFISFELIFTVGVEKEEFTKGFDNRLIKREDIVVVVFEFIAISITGSEQTLVTWEGDKSVATQKGEKANRGWKHWIEDDKLYLELTCEDAVCQQVYKRKD